MITGTPGETRYPNAPRPDVVEIGNKFEDYVCDELSKVGVILRTYKSMSFQYTGGENKVGWEIKYDEKHTLHNHLSIEIAERTRNEEGRPWTPSGIMRNDNSWLYIQGNFDLFWIMFKPALLSFFYDNEPEVKEKFGTIRTFYLPYEIADLLGKRVSK